MRSGKNTYVLNDIDEIYNVANNHKIETLYISVGDFNEVLQRCSQRYGFTIKCIYDRNYELPANIECIGFGGLKTERLCDGKLTVIRNLLPLDPSPPTHNTNKRAMLYHYGGSERNYEMLKCMEAAADLGTVNNTYVFGLNSFAYPLSNNCGTISIHKLLMFIQNIGFNICFDPLEVGATPPQIFLSHNLLSLCHVNTDATSLAPFPVFTNGEELMELLNHYRGNPDECYKKKLEIVEALNAS